MGGGGTAQSDPVGPSITTFAYSQWLAHTSHLCTDCFTLRHRRGGGGIKGGRKRVDASEIKMSLCTVCNKTTSHAFCTLATQLCSSFCSPALKSPAFQCE